MTGQTILKIDSSARYEGSQSRILTSEIVNHLTAADAAATTIERDLGRGIEQIDEAWVGANFTPDEERTEAHLARLSLSDVLVGELEAANTIVIGVPIYNFGVSNTLKAWLDLVVRVRKTFHYTESGPVGLLAGKRAILVVTSGGTAVGGEIDFATGYMKHILGFIGIHDVTVVDVGQQMMNETAVVTARQTIADIAVKVGDFEEA